MPWLQIQGLLSMMSGSGFLAGAVQIRASRLKLVALQGDRSASLQTAHQ